MFPFYSIRATQIWSEEIDRTEEVDADIEVLMERILEAELSILLPSVLK